MDEKISTATRVARFATYPLITELREELPGRIGIIGSAIVGRRIIGGTKHE